MRRVISVFFILVCSFASISFAEDLQDTKQALNNEEQDTTKSESENNSTAPRLKNIFIWWLPDSKETDKNIKENDTDNDGIVLSEYDDDTDYLNVSKLPVKGYLEYLDAADVITLKKQDDKKDFELNLSKPQKLKQPEKLFDKDNDLPHTTFARNIYNRSGLEYSIAPVDAKSEVKHGGFSLGTSYNESIDNSDLGFTTSFYTRYETKHFALSSAYNKESGIGYSMNVDKFLVAPELKLNKHISIKDIISSDITRNRKKNELVLSVKPMKDDRVRFEFGANYTFDDANSIVRSQIKFSTQYKW